MVVDTSVFIEHFRSKDRSRSTLSSLPNNTELLISAVSLYELYMGATSAEKRNAVRALTDGLTVLPFDEEVSIKAAELYHELKQKNKLIEFRDIFIAATCLVNDQLLVTLNVKHFERIGELKLAKLPLRS